MTRDTSYERWAKAAVLAREAEEFYVHAARTVEELNVDIELLALRSALGNLRQSLQQSVEKPTPSAAGAVFLQVAKQSTQPVTR